jgi:hypothetical protein
MPSSSLHNAADAIVTLPVVLCCTKAEGKQQLSHVLMRAMHLQVSKDRLLFLHVNLLT